jgi:uncharacterized HAD superfamily protein
MHTICIDIDNVLAQTDEVIRRLIREYSKNHVNLSYDDVVVFDYWRCRDHTGQRISREEWHTIHDEFISNHLLTITPLPEVHASLQRLSSCFDLHLITSRPEKGYSDTVKWLQAHDISYNALHFTQHGEKHLVSTDFASAIDDEREQGYAFHAKGVQSYLLAHPWNYIGPHSPLIRVENWQELTENLLHHLA